MARPDFICIGAQKAGTTWLYDMLQQNRSLFLPPIKELHFFDYIYLPRHRPWVAGAFARRAKVLERRPAWRGYVTRLQEIDRTSDAWYAAVFDHRKARGRLAGEITPAYSLLPSEGIARVRAINPAVKILFILRDPVDRALSHLRMTAERNKWAAVGPEVLDKPALMRSVAGRSAYRDNVARWEAGFPPGQILFLPYRRIRPEPEAVLSAVEAFIGIDPGRYRDAAEPVHGTRPTAIDPAVVAALEERLGPERDWLRTRFGADFVSG